MNERVGRWGQVRIYTGKFYRIFLHEKGWKFIAFAVIIAVLLSVVMGDKMFVEKEFTRTGMFAIVTAMIWVGVFNSIQNICREREIIKREHRTGLHISAYVAAHMIFQAALCAVPGRTDAGDLRILYGTALRGRCDRKLLYRRVHLLFPGALRGGL